METPTSAMNTSQTSDQAGPAAGSLPPEAIALATRIYDAARRGDAALVEQAVTAGLPPNMTNDKGDTLVCPLSHASSPSARVLTMLATRACPLSQALG